MSKTSELDLKTLVDICLRNWKWFFLSVAICVGLAILYMRYTIPEYSATAKIQILEDSNQASELSVLDDLDIFSSGKAKIEDETELLSARDNFIHIVRKLELNIQYFVLGNIKDTELYRKENIPFSINFLSNDSIIDNAKFNFYIKIDSNTSFGYKEREDQPEKKYGFGDKISTEIGDIILTPKQKLSQYRNKQMKVVIKPLERVADFYRKKTIISANDKKFSNIINIMLTDPIEQRAIDVINELININNSNAVSDKKAIADRTTKFINDRITEIYSNLSSVDESEESFKTSRGIADLGTQSSVNFNMSAASEQELQNANIQLSIASSMKDLISGQEDYDIIPEVGLADQSISSTAQRYNELVAQRNRLLESSNEKNPVIVKLDQQLEDLKRGMQSSLNNVTNNLNLQVNSLSKQLSQINSRIYAAPGNQRALRDISRRQQTTESLYLYLLQKREESQITFASASPKSKVINSAYGSNYPVSPKKNAIYLASFILGLLIPFSIIYVKDLLDNKVSSKVELEQLISNKAPVIAELPKVGRRENKLVSGMDRSVLGESLRILRTNLDYVLKRKLKSDQAGVVLVTSSVSGEGKTFLSSNLSMVLASAKKKVLLLGADIRNPKLHNFYTDLSRNKPSDIKARGKMQKGFTEFLYDEKVRFDEVVSPMVINENKVDIVFSGKIPPNPAELLMSDRVKEFLDCARSKYDYIIVDSAPMLVVTDTLLISDYADQILYVTKAGVTEQKVLEYPIKLLKEKKIKNLSFVVNGVKDANLGYGGKYGYGYGKSVKKWWSFS
ncbi:polysaccharide biosynthesis tyrosine autokinase [Muricauda sp. JGD-17]|uniref:non-specific protein-tyrosine kinase n=1 Tax=Flagellimonas ochracea TaxID=2696472 RepID=A0A964TAF2_9FLAO|nr:polysaccharide biosynthesis tyrosine autokinase [Allomuricauda ochracea]NAY91213.1 polysaccharide biosynthesis tyrosine autokinase [Allomuricauda ochracea]